MHIRRNWLRVLILLALVLALTAAPAAVTATDGPRHGLTITDTLRAADYSSEQLLTMARIYSMALLVGWLTIGSLVAGVVIGLTGERRASSWAVIIAAAFFWGIAIAGGRMPADAGPRLLMAGGGLAMLAAAAAGGWIGRQAALARGPEPTSPASEDQTS